MNRLKINFLLVFMMLFVACPTYADVVWPALYVSNGLLSLKVIILGLIFEILCLKFLPQVKWIKAIWVGVLMNLISCFLGGFLLIILGLGIELIPFGSFHWTHWLATYLLAVVINTIIESLIVYWTTKVKFSKIVICLFLANLISVGLCILFYGFEATGIRV